MGVAHRLKELTRPTGEEDVLHVEYPKPRLHVNVKQALAVGVAVGAIVAATIAWILAGSGGAPSAPEPQWGTAEAGNGAGEAEPDRVVVSVVGAVDNPGLVTLDNGARIADALEHARPRPEADLITLNLAQLLTDGQQIHVLAIGEAPPPGADSGPDGGAQGGPGGHDGSGISLNSASASELTELPGVGEATAASIVAHREAAGPFTAVEQLMDVKGIGPAKFEAIKDLVVL